MRKGQSFELVSLSECIPWMTVGLVESVAIVTLNLCTIIVFMRNRNLRKRSMYLVINLAVTDMFVGGVAVYYLFYWSGVDCNLWEWYSFDSDIYIPIKIFITIFVICSLINMDIIALERVHATFFPLRHRLLKKRVYRLIICVVWVISALISITYTLVLQFNETGRYLHVTFLVICILIICVSYTSIVIKVRCGAQPRHHGAASRERKLTMTLLIVTVVSLLFYLPNVIWRYVIYVSKFEILSLMPYSVALHLNVALMVLLFANSLVNPILYAVRMQEYRSAFLALVRKRPQQQRQVAVFPLREM